MNSAMNGGSTNLGIESLTTGVSKAGLTQYLESVKMEILSNVCKELNNVEEVSQAINNCWQGESRDRFMTAFSEELYRITKDLNEEYSNLESKLQSLFDAMYQLDRQGIYDFN